MLQHLDGTPFTTGKVPYSNRSPLTAGGSENRIWVIVQFGELARGAAIIDTGSPWCILSRAEAERENGGYRNEGIGEFRMLIRGDWLSGVFLRWPVTIFADEGDDLTIESTIFVPDEKIDELPNFIGLDGFLSRVNFAVDPFNQWFHFGA